MTALAARARRAPPSKVERARLSHGSHQTTPMQPDDSARKNAGHDRNGIDSESPSSGYLSYALERRERGTSGPPVTAFLADGGQTFALEGCSEREWLTADADSVMEVRP